jgi:ribonuclease PH
MVETEVYRSGGRAAHEARELRLSPGFVATAEGSVLIEVGHMRRLRMGFRGGCVIRGGDG